MYIIIYDFGTSSVKTCLFDIDSEIRLVAGSTSAKDPVWKYKWVENNEPEIFQKAYKWLDICDYLVCRLTGRIVRTADSAFGTFLYDTRKGKEGWNKGLLKMYKVNPRHMPDIIESTDLVGGLTEQVSCR